jgi:hypothetical protein
VLMALLVSLPVYGLSGTLLDLLGSHHRHRQADRVAASMDDWQDFRRSDAVHVEPQPHSHFSWQRHHHDRSDASVVALDEAAHDASNEETASSATVASAMWTTVWNAIEIHAPSGVWVAWPGDRAARVATLAVDPLDRPPNS